MSANSANDSTETYAHHYCPQNVSEQIQFAWYFGFEPRCQSVSPLASEGTLGTTAPGGSPTLQGLGAPLPL